MFKLNHNSVFDWRKKNIQFGQAWQVLFSH